MTTTGVHPLQCSAGYGAVHVEKLRAGIDKLRLVRRFFRLLARRSRAADGRCILCGNLGCDGIGYGCGHGNPNDSGCESRLFPCTMCGLDSVNHPNGSFNSFDRCCVIPKGSTETQSLSVCGTCFLPLPYANEVFGDDRDLGSAFEKRHVVHCRTLFGNAGARYPMAPDACAFRNNHLLRFRRRDVVRGFLLSYLRAADVLEYVHELFTNWGKYFLDQAFMADFIVATRPDWSECELNDDTVIKHTQTVLESVQHLIRTSSGVD